MSSTFNLQPWQKVSGDHGGTRTDHWKNNIGVRIHLKFAALGGKCLEKVRKARLSIKVSLDQPLWRVDTGHWIDSPCSAKSLILTCIWRQLVTWSGRVGMADNTNDTHVWSGQKWHEIAIGRIWGGCHSTVSSVARSSGTSDSGGSSGTVAIVTQVALVEQWH